MVALPAQAISVGAGNAPVVAAVAEVQERVLEEAIAEAQRVDAPLNVVTCWDLVNKESENGLFDDCSGNVSSVQFKLAKEAAEDVRAFVRKRAPQLDVTCALQRGGTLDVLQDASRGAREILIGADGDLPRYFWVINGTVARRMVSTLTIPTVIVPDRQVASDASVLLVLSSWMPDALRFAATRARQRGVGLIILHESDGPGSRSENRWRENCYLLDTHLSLYLDVEVTMYTAAPGHLMSAITHLSSRTALVVVGTVPRSHRPFFLDRSIAAKLATRTTVPLAVVPSLVRARSRTCIDGTRPPSPGTRA